MLYIYILYIFIYLNAHTHICRYIKYINYIYIWIFFWILSFCNPWCIYVITRNSPIGIALAGLIKNNKQKGCVQNHSHRQAWTGRNREPDEVSILIIEAEKVHVLQFKPHRTDSNRRGWSTRMNYPQILVYLLRIHTSTRSLCHYFEKSYAHVGENRRWFILVDPTWTINDAQK